MPQRRAALKRLRVDKKRHLHNLKIKQELKKVIKKFLTLINTKQVEEAKTLFKQLTTKLDRAVSIKLIHKNTASRKKSRFAKRLFKLLKPT